MKNVPDSVAQIATQILKLTHLELRVLAESLNVPCDEVTDGAQSIVEAYDSEEDPDHA